MCSQIFHPCSYFCFQLGNTGIFTSGRRGAMADSIDLQAAQPSSSEGLGAGWVCSVGHGLLRVVAVQVNLQQDSNVHKHLQESTDGELERGLVQDEVNSLECVPTAPHQHHLDAKRQKKGKSVYWEELGFGLDLLCQRMPPTAARIYTQQWVGTPLDRGRQAALYLQGRIKFSAPRIAALLSQQLQLQNTCGYEGIQHFKIST